MPGSDSGGRQGTDPLRVALPLGTVGGIKVRLNWSAAVIFALIAFDSVADILPRLTECADRRALVFSNGHLAGIIMPSDISQMIDRLGLGQSPVTAGQR